MPSSWQQYLPLVARNYAHRFKVDIEIHGQQAYSTRDTIVIPEVELTTPQKARVISGYIAHEAGHIHYSDFDLLNKLPSEFDRFLVNALEDSRVERKVVDNYPGAYDNLSALNQYLYEDHLGEADTCYRFSKLQIILSYMLFCTQQQLLEYPLSAHMATIFGYEVAALINPQALPQLQAKLMQISKCQNTQDTVDLAQEIRSLMGADFFVPDFTAFAKHHNTQSRCDYEHCKQLAAIYKQDFSLEPPQPQTPEPVVAAEDIVTALHSPFSLSQLQHDYYTLTPQVHVPPAASPALCPALSLSSAQGMPTKLSVKAMDSLPSATHSAVATDAAPVVTPQPAASSGDAAARSGNGTVSTGVTAPLSSRFSLPHTAAATGHALHAFDLGQSTKPLLVSTSSTEELVTRICRERLINHIHLQPQLQQMEVDKLPAPLQMGARKDQLSQQAQIATINEYRRIPQLRLPTSLELSANLTQHSLQQLLMELLSHIDGLSQIQQYARFVLYCHVRAQDGSAFFSPDELAHLANIKDYIKRRLGQDFTPELARFILRIDISQLRYSKKELDNGLYFPIYQLAHEPEELTILHLDRDLVTAPLPPTTSILREQRRTREMWRQRLAFVRTESILQEQGLLPRSFISVLPLLDPHFYCRSAQGEVFAKDYFVMSLCAKLLTLEQQQGLTQPASWGRYAADSAYDTAFATTSNTDAKFIFTPSVPAEPPEPTGKQPWDVDYACISQMVGAIAATLDFTPTQLHALQEVLGKLAQERERMLKLQAHQPAWGSVEDEATELEQPRFADILNEYHIKRRQYALLETNTRDPRLECTFSDALQAFWHNQKPLPSFSAATRALDQSTPVNPLDVDGSGQPILGGTAGSSYNSLSERPQPRLALPTIADVVTKMALHHPEDCSKPMLISPREGGDIYDEPHDYFVSAVEQQTTAVRQSLRQRLEQDSTPQSKHVIPARVVLSPLGERHVMAPVVMQSSDSTSLHLLLDMSASMRTDVNHMGVETGIFNPLATTVPATSTGSVGAGRSSFASSSVANEPHSEEGLTDHPLYMSSLNQLSWQKELYELNEMVQKNYIKGPHGYRPVSWGNKPQLLNSSEVVQSLDDYRHLAASTPSRPPFSQGTVLMSQQERAALLAEDVIPLNSFEPLPLHSRAYQASQAALAMAMALEGLPQVQTMATFFPGSDNLSCLNVLNPTERASHVASRFYYPPHGETPTAQALWFALHCALTLNCARNIIFLVTDGAPDDIKQTRKALEACQQQQVEVYTLGINCPENRKLFSYFEDLPQPQQLPEVLARLITELLTPPYILVS